MFAEKNVTKRLNMKYINAAVKDDAMIIRVAVDRKTKLCNENSEFSILFLKIKIIDNFTEVKA